MKTLAQTLKSLPKARQRQIAARAKALMAKDAQAIVRRAAARPIVDPRPADEILGYAKQRRTTSTADAIKADRQERDDVLVGVGPDATRRKNTPARRAVLDHADGGHCRPYQCPHCELIVWRDSDKAWVKSYCDRADRVVHLQQVNTEVRR